ncbi:hypothetical protein KJ836_00200 [Patescibacteria group bacterium]|nr:hypothetical protein [Patescibacteria group bacterium]
MKIKINYWLTISVVTGVLVFGGVLAAFSSPDSLMGTIFSTIQDRLPSNLRFDLDRANDENQAGVTVDVPEKIIADEKPDLITGSSSQIKLPSLVPQPTLPTDQVPWGQGQSNNSDSKTLPPVNQTPWGQGPSQ